MEVGQGSKVLRVDINQAGRLPDLLEKMRSSSGSVVSGAKRDRAALLASIMPLIPSTELHFLPSIIPEAVLATKEVNQGARELAYRLLVEMGRKAGQGGVIKRHLVDGAGAEVDKDEAMTENTVSANVNEYITMVAAGLAATSPHMVSATITALARLVYEFHSDIPAETLGEMVATMDVFVTSTNREVVKSALGFVKVVIVSLPASVIESGLPALIDSLFSNSSQHRVHFKAKIRHIIERLIRRFGFDRIEALVDEENKRLLTNIRKRKERARRKKASAQENGEEEEEEDEQLHEAGMGQRTLKNVGVDAFEEAIYGSESDMSDDDSDDGGHEQKRSGGKHTKESKRVSKRADAVAQEYLLQDDDQPMDLLDRGAIADASISFNRRGDSGRKRREPGQEASRFTLDEATGRMVIEDEENGEAATEEGAQIDVEGAGRAYLDRERGTHGLTTKDGVVRLNKNNKRNRAADDAMDEEQIALEEQLAAMVAEREAGKAAATKQQSAASKGKHERKQIGSEFRAKKAGGDIKRGDVSPFAYVPLSDVGGKKKGSSGKSDVRILSGKQKKRRL
jgi:ribosomal RNA-processing protein 12